MKIVKAGFSKTFPYQQFYEKIWLEAELNEGEDERTVLYELKKSAEKFFYESNAAAEKQMGAQVTLVEENKNPKSQEETIIDGINSCTELKVLQSYEMIAKRDPDSQAAYNKKFKELKK